LKIYDLQSALSNLEDMRAGRESGYRDRRSAGPGGGGYSPGSSLGSVRTSRRADPPSPNHAYQMNPNGSGHSHPNQMAGSLGSANSFIKNELRCSLPLENLGRVPAHRLFMISRVETVQSS
jgi:hypothetical protein